MTEKSTEQPVCVLLAEEVWGSALQAMRSLGRAGVDVYVATAGAGRSVYGRSRFCSGAIDVEPSDPHRFCDSIRTWMDNVVPGDRPVVVIPLSDRLVEFLHEARSDFSPRFRLSIPEPTLTEALLNKVESFRIAERAGLDVPPWCEVTSTSDTESAHRLAFPVAVRPTSWSTAGEHYFKVAVCRNKSELDAVLQVALDRGAELIAQEYIEAPDDAVEFAIVWRSTDHSATAICTGRKRRQAAPEGGVMVWGETVPLAAIDRGAVQFLDESGFTGLGGIEFISSGGTAWFIEFNPRLEAIHFLAGRAGIDTVLMEYRNLAFGLAPAEIPTQIQAAAWIGSAWLNRFRSDPKDWRGAIGDRLAFGRAPGRTKAVVDWRDPLPGAALSGRLLSRATRMLMARGK